MEKNTVVTIVLTAVVVISLFQAFQISGMDKSTPSGAAVQTIAQQTPIAQQPASSGGSAPLPANLQNLPSMVGGC